MYGYFARQFAELKRQIEANRVELLAARQLAREAQAMKAVNISLNWGEEEQSLIAILGDLLRKVLGKAQASVRQTLERAGLSVSWEIFDQAAADYAQNYTYSLIHDLTESTRRQLGQTISRWIETDEDFEDLVRKVRTITPPNPSPILRDRARLIAQTETTRVYADSRMTGFRAAGLTQMEWRTAEDELVCPICAPLAGQTGSVSAGVLNPDNGQAYTPPAHPGCRCWLVESVAELEGMLPAEVVEWRPSMSREDADKWAINSQYKSDLYHVTRKVNVRSIEQNGFDLGRENFGRVWGNGVYMSTSSEGADMYKKWFGAFPSKRMNIRANVTNVFEYDVSGIVDERRPAKLHTRILMQALGKTKEEVFKAYEDIKRLDPSMNSHDAFTELLKRAGYDGLRIRDSMIEGTFGGDQLVVFDPQKVVVING